MWAISGTTALHWPAIHGSLGRMEQKSAAFGYSTTMASTDFGGAVVKFLSHSFVSLSMVQVRSLILDAWLFQQAKNRKEKKAASVPYLTFQLRVQPYRIKNLIYTVHFFKHARNSQTTKCP